MYAEGSPRAAFSFTPRVILHPGLIWRARSSVETSMKAELHRDDPRTVQASRDDQGARCLTPSTSNGEVRLGSNAQAGVIDIFSVRKKQAVSHEELALRVADLRDKSAFAQLFSYFAPRVKSHLMTLGLEDEKAEELAQEVMVTLWRKAAQFDPQKARLSTWLFRVARNRFIDHTRRQKYTEVDVAGHLDSLIADETADSAAVEGQHRKLVSHALTKLKAPQREVIELSFYRELSHSQIAETLALPLGTVKSRIRIAFEALRNELRELA